MKNRTKRLCLPDVDFRNLQEIKELVSLCIQYSSNLLYKQGVKYKRLGQLVRIGEDGSCIALKIMVLLQKNTG